MPDFRVYAPHASASAEEIRLGSGESHHLVVVNRCRRSDPVIAFDGRGREWRCECLDAAKSAAVLRVHSTEQAAPLPHAITLAQALPKGATMDEIVRQATELGVARIVPLITERTQVHFDGDRAEKKLEKWRTAAIEAAKQCGNPWIPEIAPVQTLEELLRWASSKAVAAEDSDAQLLKLVASLHAGAKPLHSVLAAARATPKAQGAVPHALWLVGPEGDFSPAEINQLQAAGVLPVTLGPLVLRCDTAAVAAISVLAYELSR